MGNHDVQIMQNVQHGRLDVTMGDLKKRSSACKDLLKSVLERNPHKRLGAHQVLDHHWFKVFSCKEADTVDEQVGASYAASIKNLQTKHNRNVLHNRLWLWIAHKCMHKKEKEQITTMFRRLDVNGDGKLS